MNATGHNERDSDPRFNTKFDHLIEQTRQLLTQKIPDVPKDTYYEFDVSRFMKEDFRVRRFLYKFNGSIELAVDSMISAFQWIKSNNLRDLQDTDFPTEIYLLGSVFLYEPDVNGRRVFYMRHKHNHTMKDIHELKMQFLAYNLLKAADAAGEAGLSMVVDMSGISWSNIELSMLTFLHQMGQNFPFEIALCLFVDLPKFCQATFNVFKYAFPSEVRSSVMAVSHDQLTKYIDINNIPPFLGGRCQMTYSGPQVVPSNSTYIVDHGKRLGFHKDQIVRIFSFYRKEIEKLSKECPWSNQELWQQLDQTIAPIVN